MGSPPCACANKGSARTMASAVAEINNCVLKLFICSLLDSIAQPEMPQHMSLERQHLSQLSNIELFCSERCCDPHHTSMVMVVFSQVMQKYQTVSCFVTNEILQVA